MPAILPLLHDPVSRVACHNAVRVLAAQEDTSVSAMLAARLQEIVGERKIYNRARSRALARLREGMNLAWTPPSRDELHK